MTEKRRLVIHLASGQSVVTHVEVEEDADDDEIVSAVKQDLTGDARPGWRTIGDVVAFSQAISAIEID
jgi:hypothetical protein